MQTNNIAIPEEFIALIESKKNGRIYRPRELIYEEGEHATCFYYLKCGQVKIFVSSDNGTEKTLAIYRAQSFLGEAAFFDGFPRMSSARAQTEALVIGITRQDILEWFRQKPDLALSMIASLSKTIRMLSGQINQISFLAADQRLAGFLLDETSPDRSIVRFTHEEIGDLIGVSRVTVSRILREFKKRKWIETQYGSIHLLSRDSLVQFIQP